jgi:hypothetical protein
MKAVITAFVLLSFLATAAISHFTFAQAGAGSIERTCSKQPNSTISGTI